MALALLLPALAAAAPGDVLFSDTFEDGTLAGWTTNNTNRSGVSNLPGFAGTGAFGAFTRYDPVTVTSPTFNAAVPAARLDMWIRRGSDAFSEDTDAGEDFIVEYRNNGGGWSQVAMYLGSGVNGQTYNLSFFLPADGLHGNLAIRVRQTGGSGVGYDWWHFDDVVVTEVAVSGALALGSCETFESGLGGSWNVSPAGGFAGISNATFQSPGNSLFLNGGVVSVESVDVDTGHATFESVSVWVRRGSDAFSEFPDGGENLVIEYRNDVGAWVALETFTGGTSPGQIFNRTYPMPASAQHAAFRIRLRMTGGSGAPWDFWHVDDVCLDQDTDPVLSVTKASETQSDPINAAGGPYAIPGAVVEYTVSVGNAGLGPVDSDTLEISDVVPAGTALLVQTASGDAISLIDGTPSSGLNYDFATDVSYSSNPGGGAPYNYTPVPDSNGFDPLVTGFLVEPGGAMAGDSGSGAPNFDIVFRVRIE